MSFIFSLILVVGFGGEYRRQGEIFTDSVYISQQLRFSSDYKPKIKRGSRKKIG
jgi:hypothetical protein